MRNVSDKSCRENQNTRFVFIISLSEILAIYETTLTNMVESARPQMTTWRMRFSYWITKATDRHSEYVILIAFPQQQ
jgi:hypothetical protein